MEGKGGVPGHPLLRFDHSPGGSHDFSPSKPEISSRPTHHVRNIAPLRGHRTRRARLDHFLHCEAAQLQARQLIPEVPAFHTMT